MLAKLLLRFLQAERHLIFVEVCSTNLGFIKIPEISLNRSVSPVYPLPDVDCVSLSVDRKIASTKQKKHFFFWCDGANQHKIENQNFQNGKDRACQGSHCNWKTWKNRARPGKPGKTGGFGAKTWKNIAKPGKNFYLTLKQPKNLNRKNNWKKNLAQARDPRFFFVWTSVLELLVFVGTLFWYEKLISSLSIKDKKS